MVTLDEIEGRIAQARAADDAKSVELLELAAEAVYSRRSCYRATPEHRDRSLFSLLLEVERCVAQCPPGFCGEEFKELERAIGQLKKALEPAPIMVDGVRGLWVDCPLCGTAHFDSRFTRDSELCDSCIPLSHGYSITFPEWSTFASVRGNTLSFTVRDAELRAVATHFEAVAKWMRAQAPARQA
jgi:hypothetical protein